MGSPKADLVLRNAGAITLDRRFPHARTICIQNGLILKVSAADIDRSLTGPDTGIIDCEGKTVIPAFHDAHCHIVAYAEGLVNVDVSPASVQSIEELVNKIRKIAAVTPSGQWIRCSGYNEFYLKERRHPLRYDLDRATLAHPVKLAHRSGHAHVLNTRALKLAGISNESEEPDGGMIERDLESGEPNGLLYGMGAHLSRNIPPSSSTELDTAIELAGNTLFSLGITSLQDASPGNDLRRWQQFADWKRRSLFRPRTILMFGADEAGQIEGLQAIDGELNAGAVKIVLDEVRGKLNPSQCEINRMLLDISKRGLQAAIHAVEENTVNAAIDALGYALTNHPRQDHRHRIEHCSICSPAAAARLAVLGAMIVTNPAFIYYSGERYLSEVPPGQFKRLYAINTMLGAGLRVAAGSDAPVTVPDPLKAIYAAVVRRAETGQPVLSGQSIAVLDALRLFTSGAAWSCFREKQLGTISRGKYADLVVLNADPLRVKAEGLKDIKVEMTLLSGNVVYNAAA
jgi:hypothetical protein